MSDDPVNSDNMGHAFSGLRNSTNTSWASTLFYVKAHMMKFTAHAGTSGLMLMPSLSWSQKMKNTMENKLWASFIELNYKIYMEWLGSYVVFIRDSLGIKIFKLVNEKCIVTKWHIFVWIVCAEENITCQKIVRRKCSSGSPAGLWTKHNTA